MDAQKSARISLQLFFVLPEPGPVRDAPSLPALPLPLRPLPAKDDAPSCIPGYRLHALLGSGGMATVYLAERETEVGRRRWCALKVPTVRTPGAAFENMFMAEARIAADLHHPYVCGVFDYGTESGRVFMAMEYASGRSLLDVFRAKGGRPAAHAEACRIARLLIDVCEGLQAIHEQSSVTQGPLGLVHRDISPDNIVLTYDGFAKIIDLGLVKTEHHGEKTEPGFVKGKISYVAPELLSGELATAQSDVWSLGVVAWELLTGRRLFHEATDIATLRKVIDHQILPPSEVATELPRGLDAIVLRALERDPKERYVSAAEFASDLWVFLSNQRRMVQHSDVAAWMSELFPGERQAMESWLYALARPSVVGEAPTEARSRLRSLPKVGDLLRRIRSQSSARLRSVPRRSAIASVGVAFVLGLLAVVSQLGWSRPSSALSLNHGNGAPAQRAARHRVIDSSLVPSGFVVEVESSQGSSDLVLRIRPPRATDASSGSAVAGAASPTRATN